MTCWPALLRSQTGEAPGDAGVVYLLRLQPDAQCLGRRHWYALSFVLPTRVTGQHYYADFSLSITTNWLGYILLAGIIFTAGVVELPDHWYVNQTTLRILGIGLLMIIAVYLWFCAFAKHRHMTIKGQKLVLP